MKGYLLGFILGHMLVTSALFYWNMYSYDTQGKVLHIGWIEHHELSDLDIVHQVAMVMNGLDEHDPRLTAPLRK
jgi:hypothetical protein